MAHQSPISTSFIRWKELLFFAHRQNSSHGREKNVPRLERRFMQKKKNILNGRKFERTFGKWAMSRNRKFKTRKVKRLPTVASMWLVLKKERKEKEKLQYTFAVFELFSLK